MSRKLSSALAFLAALALVAFAATCSAAPEPAPEPGDTAGGVSTVHEESLDSEFAAGAGSSAPAPTGGAPAGAAPTGATDGVASGKDARSSDVAGAPPPSPATVSPSSASGYMPSTGYAPPSASGLKAGFSDDNAQFNYFVEFLQKYDEVRHYPYDIGERLTLKVLDSAGKPIPNARVEVKAGGALVASGLTYADGGFRFYPAGSGVKAAAFEVTAVAGDLSGGATVDRDGPRTVELRLQGGRRIPAPIPLDVLFVVDTTGSMGEEINRLKATIEIIYANLSALKPRPLVRFGLVLYKDHGDEYVTKRVAFTEDLDAFQLELNQVRAGGGGDGPEDLETALYDAVNNMDWNAGGIRLAFIVTDAEAHLDYNRQYTYINAANDARAKAVKLFTIGTGGLPLEGEYLLRQVAQLTDAKYIFLTYGESGEAGGGREGSVSHHTGANYETDKLEAIIIRFVKDEVAFLSDAPPEVDEDYFTADRIDDETRDDTLDKLFAEALGNLADYSSYRIGKDTPCAVLPIAPMADGTAATAEYFGERLSMAAAALGRFTVVERKDFQKILEELELQLSGIVDEGSAARVGELLGADILVGGALYLRGDRYELFLKLVRVSTAEVLAVTRAKIDLDLGL